LWQSKKRKGTRDDKKGAGTGVKGTMSWGLLHFGVKNVLKFKLNVFSRTQNTPRIGGNSWSANVIA